MDNPLPSRKGTAEKVRDGEHNIVSRVLEVLNKPVILKEPTAIAPVTAVVNNIWTSGPLIIEVNNNTVDSTDNLQAELVISDSPWIQNMMKVTNSHGLMQTIDLNDIDDNEAHHAKLLKNILQSRFQQHLSLKVDANKHSHWAWQFVKDNLAIVSSHMILFKHVKPFDYLRFHGHRECVGLLVDRDFNNCFPTIMHQSVKDLEGTYLYYDTVGDQWIRSGKVTGGKKGTLTESRTFERRHTEHLKSAGLPDDKAMESRFYMTYPSTSARHTSATARGSFDKLNCHTAFSFNRSKSEDVTLLTKDYDDGGLIRWNTSVLNQIRTRKSPPLNDREVVLAQLQLVAYLFELGYDLCLESSSNVSRSPGFESYTHQYCNIFFSLQPHSV